jgi:hypothetical protein
MPACERCSATVASDSVNCTAALRSPNGTPLYVEIRLRGSSSPLFAHPSFFCSSCWVSFLGSIGLAAPHLRFIDDKTRSAVRVD